MAHLSTTVMLSAGAIAEMEAGFDELEPDLRAAAGKQLDGRVHAWGSSGARG